MYLSVFILTPGKLKASLMWKSSYSSTSRRSIKRKSVSAPMGSCSVLMVMEVRLDVWLRASSYGLFQL